MNVRCFFVGHSDAPQGLKNRLKAEVERHIRQFAVKDFVVGQYGAFDRMAARAVFEAKREHPEITLGVLLAYHPAECPVCSVVEFDYTVYPEGMERIPRRVAIVRAVQCMIKSSDYLIAYAWKPGSNARKLLEYAQRQDSITITQLN